MQLKTLLVTSLLVLSGCQSADMITQQTALSQVNTVGGLSFNYLKVPSSKSVVISEDTQVLSNTLMNSPVAAFELPANRGKLDIKITSQITDSVFSPLVIILDKQGNVIDKYDASFFEYRRAKLILADRLVAELDFYPPTGLKSVDMLIYTDKKELSKVTMAVHPGRAMAEAKGDYFPELKDIAKPHVKTGLLLVEVDGASRSLVDKKTTKSVDMTRKKIEPQAETATFYKVAIQTAVEEHNLPKALSLLDEAKALNIEGAQEIFIHAVNSSK